MRAGKAISGGMRGQAGVAGQGKGEAGGRGVGAGRGINASPIGATTSIWRRGSAKANPTSPGVKAGINNGINVNKGRVGAG